MPEFVEHGRFRYMRFGFPAGLLFFAMTAVWLGGSPDLPTYAFLAVFALLIGQSVGMALRTAHRVRLTEPELLAFTPAGRVAVPWSNLRRLEVIDRKGLGYPRRLLRVEADGVEIFVLDSIASFDLLVSQLSKAGGAIPVTPVPGWRKLMLLQWGV